jgi:integral membrane protein (TIGR01906 family)
MAQTTTSTTPTPASRESARGVLPAILRVFLTAAIPVLLVLISIRLIMTPLYLQIEYNRPGFPDDYYGFTLEDRLNYAPYAIDYLNNGADIGYLGNLRFPDGTPLYNSRELRHMRDVKIVTQYTYLFAVILGVAALAAAFVLWLNPSSRPSLRRAMFNGAIVTLSIVFAVVVLSIFSWDTFFTSFHNLFFAEGTWQFLYSDTLIRLFPEQFWFDTALAIGGMTVSGALVLLAVSVLLSRRNV